MAVTLKTSKEAIELRSTHPPVPAHLDRGQDPVGDPAVDRAPADTQDSGDLRDGEKLRARHTEPPRPPWRKVSWAATHRSVTTTMLASRPMPNKPRGCRLVVFHHLGCAFRFAVDSPVARVRHVDEPTWPEDTRWFAQVLQPQSRDQFQKSLAFAIDSLSKTPRNKPLDVKGAAGLIEPMHGRLELGSSTLNLGIHCKKCGTDIDGTPAQLVRAARRHPGQQSAGDQLVAYIADRAEVLYCLDDYAGQLVARDLRNTRRLQDSRRR